MTSHQMPRDGPLPTRVSRGSIVFLAIAAAVATSTSYTVQPELGAIAGDLRGRSRSPAQTLAVKHSPTRQALALGCVTAGISTGILLGRLVGGGLTDAVGGRAMLLLVAGVCLLCALIGLVLLACDAQRASGSWLAGLLPAPQLLRTHPELLVAATAGALWFFAFSLIWVGVSLALSLPPYSLAPTTVGLYSLAGLAGMAADLTGTVRRRPLRSTGRQPASRLRPGSPETGPAEQHLHGHLLRWWQLRGSGWRSLGLVIPLARRRGCGRLGDHLRTCPLHPEARSADRRPAAS